ncbi:MAG: hypothetical protein Ct9H90mP13_09980 [Pseudomonadota bacterium]|nr:MAG: hypothetical protein Ct9H90mP13_09980 [Pseudomonadota bacterium]
MKKRLREGAKLIVVDPRKTDIVESPHIKADYHLPILPGSNVPLINAFSHYIVKEGLLDLDYVRERCDQASFEDWLEFIKDESNSPEAAEAPTGVSLK